MSASSSNPQPEGDIYVKGVPTAETRLTLGGGISVSPMAIGTWSWGVRTIHGRTDRSILSYV